MKHGNYKQLLKKINTLVFDIDGVMTNGNVQILSNGEQIRTVNVKDSYALQLAVKKGFNVIILSGGKSYAMYHRLDYLGVKNVFTEIADKYSFFTKYIANNNINLENVLYMGDDIPDYQIMTKVGVATCPSDACEEIKSIAQYISDKKGGCGCVRDVIEQVMKVQNKWFDKDAFSF
jgi:3-deoxy-D-manno-octulosonate 8-phosphate phosphatase (KDO 8-P phosphatase)